jgi:plastocyanin
VRLTVVIAAAIAALLASGGGATPTQNTKLFGTVGPGFTISLRDASGARVTRLDPGTYDIEVEDLSEEHNFHLTGPGVNRTTEIGDTGTASWTVTFTDGTYRYVCDPHSGSMSGSFTVGSGGTPPATSSPITSTTKLQLTSGPGFTITLRTSAGKAVTSMRTGTYTVVVRDRSRIHNAHLVAPGYNRLTKPLTYVGAQTWKVTLARSGTLRFLCDPHSASMKGSARIVR